MSSFQWIYCLLHKSRSSSLIWMFTGARFRLHIFSSWSWEASLSLSFAHSHVWKHFNLSWGLNNRALLACAPRLPDKVWLIGQSLVESELGEISLLFYCFFTNTMLASWSYCANIRLTLTLKLLIEVSVPFWSNSSLRLWRPSGVFRLIWLLQSLPTNSGTSQGIRFRVICSLLASGLLLIIICFDQLVIKDARNSRRLKKTLVLLSVIRYRNGSFRSSFPTFCLAGHSSNLGRWCRIYWLRVAFGGLSTPYYHLHFLLLVLSYWKVLLFDGNVKLWIYLNKFKL